MNGSLFLLSASASILCWIAASAMAWARKNTSAVLWPAAAGTAILAVFIGGYWAYAGRPPLATLAETRLWYAFFLFLCGLLVYARCPFRWLPAFVTVLSGIFLAAGIFRIGPHGQELMPVLKSFWFVPHVIAYIFAYGLSGIAFLLALYALACGGKGRRLAPERPERPENGKNAARKTEKGQKGCFLEKSERRSRLMDRLMEKIDELTLAGAGFLTAGLCMGAIWAKQAWGYFWTWDPKETWALATLLCYALYIGARKSAARIPALGGKPSLVIQIAGFACLQLCWYGVHYLNAAKGLSVHIYG